MNILRKCYSIKYISALVISYLLVRGMLSMAIKISFSERDNYLIRPRSLCMWASKVLLAKSFKLKMGVFLLFHVT